MTSKKQFLAYNSAGLHFYVIWDDSEITLTRALIRARGHIFIFSGHIFSCIATERAACVSTWLGEIWNQRQKVRRITSSKYEKKERFLIFNFPLACDLVTDNLVLAAIKRESTVRTVVSRCDPFHRHASRGGRPGGLPLRGSRA